MTPTLNAAHDLANLSEKLSFERYRCDSRQAHLAGRCQTWDMRKLKLIYVENDGALRGLLAHSFDKSERLELVGSFASASELIDSGLAKRADAALLDYSLDSAGLNGVELGIHLRNLNEHIGIIIYSQFSVAPMIRRVPSQMLSGWSFLQKSAMTSLQNYEVVIEASASGRGNWEEVSKQSVDDLDSQASLFFKLTPRQRSILALASQSKSGREISEQLNLSYAHVRRELSRAYQVLLPNAQESDDLKTAAVLKYLELMKVAQ